MGEDGLRDSQGEEHVSADHRSLRTSIGNLWERRAEQVRSETEGQLATELRALKARGLFPGPSSQAGYAAARVAQREGESILRATLTEALEIDGICREGLGNDELVRDLESAFQTCIEEWARRRVPRLLTLANFRSVTNDIERDVVFYLRTTLGREIRAEVAKLWLERHAEQDSSAASLRADRRPARPESAQVPAKHLAVDTDLLGRLERLEPRLADSYRQVIADLSASDRHSYLGTAAEIRELINAVIQLLASEVQVCAWLAERSDKAEGKEGKPSRKQRIQFMLGQRATPGTTTETVVKSAEHVQSLLASLVASWYDRASAGTHAGASRHEVIRLTDYAVPFLKDLLPPA